ncbi:TetR/AcrR family transcriptional regulator [Defluviitalea phaphyphila]|uniref:TetR/AcrR family transcriptional regulator n=1 Tax=Defluviitalea phaphyphila TaxID=1473580 RepID=UPI000731855A|nr:TetR/AcrR family transcriptional regulator [Defluviitalea phaphyphila]
MKEEPTKNKIIQATLDVIEEKTISGTRMRSIAEKAQVFQSNLHYYYKSKNELLLDAQKEVARRCREIRQEARKNADDTLESQLDVFIKQKLLFIKEEKKYDYAEIDFWVHSRFNESFREEFKNSFYGWRNELQELIETYAPNYDKDKKVLLASAIISLLEGATIQYLIDSEAFSVEKYFEYCKELIIKEMEKNNLVK